ncbi:MAG: phosphoribosylformylglycinamidine cyclo-ligase [Candidatus Komeilibacteria bacterium]|nr:phosphoribosylformylglycinamidine cyclo-ligase [Candidatus Komeilibacteria bacterium]
MSIDYKSSGVNIDVGNEAVKRIKDKVKSTFDKNVVTGLGTFGAMYNASWLKDFKEPILVQSIDGVGTKLKVAQMAGQLQGVGEDIVNHCCGDILCQGARGLTFLDYLASDKLNPQEIEDMVSGMVKACKAANISLIGGETAEMPGVYIKGEHDIAGVIMGVVEKDKIITGDKIKAGDVALGLASVGLHTNGFSLARKIFFESGEYDTSSRFEELAGSLGEELLIPHHNYAPAVLPLLEKYEVKGIAHITGGGLIENVPRVLPKDLSLEITKGSWDILPIFKLMQKVGGVSDEEMHRVFNMGIGLVMIISSDQVDALKKDLEQAGEKVYQIGQIVKGNQDVKFI